MAKSGVERPTVGGYRSSSMGTAMRKQLVVCEARTNAKPETGYNTNCVPLLLSPHLQYLSYLLLKNSTTGPGDPYRTGDLPVDFHTTEIINKYVHT